MIKRNSKLAKLMHEELPSVTFQKKLLYRTNHHEVLEYYRLINKTIFKNKLIEPEIHVKPRCRKYWGECLGYEFIKDPKNKSRCKISIMDKWYCKQWLITVLAHEMCHQYQWDIERKNREQNGKSALMSHGPSFFIFREKLAEHYIPLKRSYSKRRWFETQNMFRC